MGLIIRNTVLSSPRSIHPTATWLGIDPGASGGIAILHGREVTSVSMPDTERDVWDFFQENGWRGDTPQFAIIEKVGGYIGTNQPGSSAFKFGVSYGGLRMALIAAGVPFEEVVPQRWQKEYALKRAKDEPKHIWKGRLKAKAAQLFPKVHVTLATSDALLIAEYARRKYTGSLSR